MTTLLFAPYGLNDQGQSFRPHPTQQKILDWTDAIRAGRAPTSGIPVLYVQHGVNSGTTRGCLAPVVECLLEYPGLRVLIGRRDFNDLRLSVMETFFEIVPPELILLRDNQLHFYTMRAKGGKSVVAFRGLKDITGLGSVPFSIIYVPEAKELEEKMYRTLKERCGRQRGLPAFLLLEGNAPVEGHWLEALTDLRSDRFDPDFTRLICSSEENQTGMSPQYWSMLMAMPETWRRRHVLGLTGALSDGTPVYPSFVESVHVRPTALIPDRPLIRAWDFGLRRAACVWAQTTVEGHVLVHREWLPLEVPETQFIDGVIQRTNEWFGPKVCRDVGDPAATHRDPEGVSTLRRLMDAGIRLESRVTTYGQRIPLINQKLSTMLRGDPLVSINPPCAALIEGLLGGWHYPKLDENHEFTLRKDLPYRDGYYEHICNAWEYLMVNLFDVVKPEVRRAHQQSYRRRLQPTASSHGSTGIW